MAENTSNPKVIVKKKNINVLVEFCLDESIEFSVKQQTFPDTDWEVELRIKDIKTAIVVGMFLRENKFEIEGLDQNRIKKPVAKKADEKPEKESKSGSSEPQASTEGPTLM